MAEKCNANQIGQNILCEEAKEAIGRIWTVGVMVASAGPVIFGFLQPKEIQHTIIIFINIFIISVIILIIIIIIIISSLKCVPKKIGLFFTRIICGTSTTLGLLMMSFYRSNVNFLFWGSLLCKLNEFRLYRINFGRIKLILVALPAISYIVLNTVIAPVYPRISVILIVIIPGLVNSSATCLLIAKKLWQHDGDLRLDAILFYLAIASILIHVRTVFLMPFTPLPANVNEYRNG